MVVFLGGQARPILVHDRCPCSICFEVNRFSKRRKDSHDMPRLLGMILPTPKRSFKSVCMFSESSKNHHKPFNPNPNWRTTAINKGKLQTNSTSLPPYQVLVIFKLLPSSFAGSKSYLSNIPTNLKSHSPPVVMADLE